MALSFGFWFLKRVLDALFSQKSFKTLSDPIPTTMPKIKTVAQKLREEFGPIEIFAY